MNSKIGKMESMLLGAGKRLSLLSGKQLGSHVDGNLIDSTTNYKYLGLHSDSTLIHLDKTSKKANISHNTITEC